MFTCVYWLYFYWGLVHDDVVILWVAERLSDSQVFQAKLMVLVWNAIEPKMVYRYFHMIHTEHFTLLL